MIYSGSTATANPQISTNHKQLTTNKISVQFCSNCESHLFTVRHDEQKYQIQYQNIRNSLIEKGVSVKKRAVPKELFRKSPYCPQNVYYNNNGQIVYFPQIGSFEVYLGDEKIFSKLQSNRWPTADLLFSLIKSRQNEVDIKEEKVQIIEKQIIKDQNHEQESNRTKEQIKQKSSFSLRITSYEGGKYSLNQRNLLTKKPHSKNYTARYINRRKDQTSEERNQAQIVRMYSPAVTNKNHHIEMVKKFQLEGIPTVEGKERVAKANVYLEPIFPKTKVNLQNYQKYRLIVSKKIHSDRLAFQARKMHQQEATTAKEKHIHQQNERKNNIKFNNHITTLQNIRETTEENQPKILIIKQEKKQKQIAKKQDVEEMKNSLKLPKIQKQDQEWKQYHHEKKDTGGEVKEGKIIHQLTKEPIDSSTKVVQKGQIQRKVQIQNTKIQKLSQKQQNRQDEDASSRLKQYEQSKFQQDEAVIGVNKIVKQQQQEQQYSQPFQNEEQPGQVRIDEMAKQNKVQSQQLEIKTNQQILQAKVHFHNEQKKEQINNQRDYSLKPQQEVKEKIIVKNNLAIKQKENSNSEQFQVGHSNLIKQQKQKQEEGHLIVQTEKK